MLQSHSQILSGQSPIKVVVAQKSSREHFAIARALHRRGLLALLVADWYAPRSRFARLLVNCFPRRFAQRALAAEAPELPPEVVRGLNGFGLRRRIPEVWSRRMGRPLDGYTISGAMFARKVSSMTLPPHNVFFAYSYDSLEALEAEKTRGILTVVDQVDPGAFEHDLVAEESKRWKSYALSEAQPPAAYFRRNRQEWQVADVIVVNSEWSKQALIRSGAPKDKLEVLPLAYEADAAELPRRANHGAGNFRVIWLGAVCLRKGIQYLVEAAGLLLSHPIEFLVGGRLEISALAIREAPRNMTFFGQVPRSQARTFYQQGDVFVLPTVSDGFAMTQLEALAHGLPVIVTPHCGRVVEDGATGFIVPARDPKALAQALLRFVRDRTLPAKMAPQCRAAANAYSIDSQGKQLVAIIQNNMARVRVSARDDCVRECRH
jgi:glycosyltransferase involved in cell wall biosynthesis